MEHELRLCNVNVTGGRRHDRQGRQWYDARTDARDVVE